MALKSNTFEGGTHAADITVANSGGASGDPFDHVSNTPTYDNTAPGVGTMCSKHSAKFHYVRYLQPSGTANLYLSVWLKYPVLPSAATREFNVYDAAGNLSGFINLSAGGKFGIGVGNTTTVYTADAGIITTDSWLKIKARFGADGTGTLEVYLNPTSATPSTTLDMTGAAVTDHVRIDGPRASGVTDAAFITFADEYQVSDAPISSATTHSVVAALNATSALTATPTVNTTYKVTATFAVVSDLKITIKNAFAVFTVVSTLDVVTTTYASATISVISDLVAFEDGEGVANWTPVSETEPVYTESRRSSRYNVTNVVGLRYTFVWNGTHYVDGKGLPLVDRLEGTFREFVGPADPNALGLMIDGDSWQDTAP